MTNMSIRRTYKKLMLLDTYEKRVEYLKLLDKLVAEETFGGRRYFNQKFYTSLKWRQLRNHIIIRDNGCDLGIEGMPITDKIIIHHLNPITLEDILYDVDELYDPENLICVSHKTHNIIHYGTQITLFEEDIERSPYDTCPWR